MSEFVATEMCQRQMWQKRAIITGCMSACHIQCLSCKVVLLSTWIQTRVCALGIR